MAGLPTYAPEEAPQWVHDVVENLQREHDKRVVEYIELEKRLPTGLEISAIRFAINECERQGATRVAKVLSAYVDRWKNAQS